MPQKSQKTLVMESFFSKVAYLQSGFTGNSIVLDMKIMEHREAKKKRNKKSHIQYMIFATSNN